MKEHEEMEACVRRCSALGKASVDLRVEVLRLAVVCCARRADSV